MSTTFVSFNTIFLNYNSKILNNKTEALIQTKARQKKEK